MSDLKKVRSAVTTAEKKLKTDLEKYRRMALDMGAADVRILPSSDFVQTLKARMAAVFPRDMNANSTYFSLPIFLNYPWQYTKAILAAYRYVIIAKIEFSREDISWITGPTSGGSLPNLLGNAQKYMRAEDVEYWRKVQAKRQGDRPAPAKLIRLNISRTIEAEAREDGHQFAFSGTSGVCIGLCEKYGRVCVALKTGLCRHPGKTRPNGTAAIMGMDLPATYAKLGWQNWVHGWSVFPEDYPSGFLTPPPHSVGTIYID